MKTIRNTLAGLGFASLALFAHAGGSVHFIEPVDGATVGASFTVRMGVEGMAVRPAGELIDGTGHHHLIVNGQPIAAGVAVPADDTHLHFGKGQTETMLTLPPGMHTLTMQFADGLHRSYGPALSRTITITVK